MRDDLNKENFYVGWAMDAYPEMTKEEIRRHVIRQKERGCNFVWGGHNNPGEVDRAKIEPGMSYAIYDALVAPNHPKKQDAEEIFQAQMRLLEVCHEENQPIVFPVGYQIQMGEKWNENNPKHLRRDADGNIVDWGGRSACFYSPRYQEDIMRYYGWVIREMIKPFSNIIRMVNLADEPFGGDYSYYAEVEFKRRYGMKFNKAYNAGKQGAFNLGEFQCKYIAEYAAWSARTWYDLDEIHPTTISFCGHHGREDYAMPYIPAVFELTPKSFHPTWDVYPRDGSFENPPKESDITPLLIFLQQLSYLSARYSRPYWLWVTGNSWGLGQNSDDKADIADALMNQLYVIAEDLKYRSHLNGIAVWNYNVKHQGLYNDTNPIIYNPDEMFEKVTCMLSAVRKFMDKEKSIVRSTEGITLFPENSPTENAIPAEVILTASEDFIFRSVGKSRKSVYPYPIAFPGFHTLAKSNARVRLCEDTSKSMQDLSFLIQHEVDNFVWLVLSDDDDPDLEWAINSVIFRNLLSRVNTIVPKKLIGKDKKKILSKLLLERFLTVYETVPNVPGPDFQEQPFIHLPRIPLYHFQLGETHIYYNLSKADCSLGALADDETFNTLCFEESYQILILSPQTRILHQCAGSEMEQCPPVLHHGILIIGPANDYWMKFFCETCNK